MIILSSLIGRCNLYNKPALTYTDKSILRGLTNGFLKKLKILVRSMADGFLQSKSVSFLVYLSPHPNLYLRYTRNWVRLTWLWWTLAGQWIWTLKEQTTRSKKPLTRDTCQRMKVLPVLYGTKWFLFTHIRYSAADWSGGLSLWPFIVASLFSLTGLTCLCLSPVSCRGGRQSGQQYHDGRWRYTAPHSWEWWRSLTPPHPCIPAPSARAKPCPLWPEAYCCKATFLIDRSSV